MNLGAIMLFLFLVIIFCGITGLVIVFPGLDLDTNSYILGIKTVYLMAILISILSGGTTYLIFNQEKINAFFMKLKTKLLIKRRWRK